MSRSSAVAQCGDSGSCWLGSSGVCAFKAFNQITYWAAVIAMLIYIYIYTIILYCIKLYYVLYFISLYYVTI